MTNKEQRDVTGSAPVETPPQGNLARLRKRTEDLSDLLSDVTEDNLHPEQDTGEPRAMSSGNDRV